LEAAADSIRSGPGQWIMDEFQGVVRGLQDEELRLLVLRNADAQRRLGQTKTEAQGYYFSPPVLPEQVASLLKTGIPEASAVVRR
jgi:hypothetical protein